MPGDDLLFQRLSVSTIGAVWFHGRVRDGIGWVTNAMVTKQCSRRSYNMDVGFKSISVQVFILTVFLIIRHQQTWSKPNGSRPVIDGGTLYSSAKRVIRIG